jgi:hypothetical protein
MCKIRMAIVSTVAAIASIVGASGVASAAATPQTTVIRTPVSDTVSLICVDEPVFVTGYLQTTVHITQNASGGFTVVQTSSAQDFHGTGQTTGQEYRIVGPPFNNTISHSTSGSPATTFTNEVEASIIGQGQPNPGPVFHIRITEHVTVNANGDVTAEVSQFSSVCV